MVAHGIVGQRTTDIRVGESCRQAVIVSPTFATSTSFIEYLRFSQKNCEFFLCLRLVLQLIARLRTTG